MQKIALTGGIGTGKTFVSKFFVDVGIPVYNADEEAKKLYDEPEIIRLIVAKFGQEVLTNSKVDFYKLASLIFDDSEKIRQINGIIHPVLMEHFNNWAEQQNCRDVILESAIVFEAGLDHYFDFIITVDAPFDVRLNRIKIRNPSLSEEDIRKRINSQMEQSLKCEKADLVIFNA
jgi:dephospho-CoA kinase